ncbi:F-box protein At5g07610 [Daucus carota subsp. sativus]
MLMLVNFIFTPLKRGLGRSCIKSLCPAPRISWFKAGVYWNGGMHWLSECSETQPSSDGFYFNVDKERLQTFPSPPMAIKEFHYSSYFGESQGHLHYAEVCPYDPSLNVYEMKSDYSGWFVKYQIDLVPISKAFPVMKERAYYSGESFNAAVALLVRTDNFKEDSFLVLELPGQIIHYNLVDRSFRVICNFGEDLQKRRLSLCYYSCGGLKAWPYNQ